MYRNVLESIGIYSNVYEWSRYTTMQNLELLTWKMVFECKGMYLNVLEYIAVYNAKFGVPNLKNGIGMQRNVLKCIGMDWNVL